MQFEGESKQPVKETNIATHSRVKSENIKTSTAAGYSRRKMIRMGRTFKSRQRQRKRSSKQPQELEENSVVINKGDDVGKKVEAKKQYF
mmetsp:Transcript_29238/g.33498  ORF Transcript_29238/g.33498 Transcript_29238/m.33498 type:complete len:89 (-) Transcript_29238:40-306(-)